MANKETKGKALGIAIDITKLYAGSGHHGIPIEIVLENVYDKLILLSDDVLKTKNEDS